MPALRGSVTVSGDIVRIGDLIENAGPVADVPIFRAPDLGTRGAVPTERIVEAIRPHQLIGIDTRGLSEVIVTRASRTITTKEISARIAQVLEGQYGLGEARNILVEFDRDVRTLNVEPTATGDLQVLTLAYNPRTSRFDVTFDLPSSAALRRQNTRFSGIAIETINAVTRRSPGRTRRDPQGVRSQTRAAAEVAKVQPSPTSARSSGLPHGTSCGPGSRCTRPI